MSLFSKIIVIIAIAIVVSPFVLGALVLFFDEPFGVIGNWWMPIWKVVVWIVWIAWAVFIFVMYKQGKA